MNGSMAPVPPVAAGEFSVCTYGRDSSASEDTPGNSRMTPRSRSLSRSGSLVRKSVGAFARRTLGLGLLLATVFLWTGSNFLASVSLQFRYSVLRR